jgi:hypothetical protein
MLSLPPKVFWINRTPKAIGKTKERFMLEREIELAAEQEDEANRLHDQFLNRHPKAKL